MAEHGWTGVWTKSNISGDPNHASARVKWFENGKLGFTAVGAKWSVPIKKLKHFGRIHQYCEKYNPWDIKRGVVTMKKRCQRINEGAQKFGACYDEAQQKIGSGSNLDKIIEKTQQDHLTNYKKKSNFELHWCELRRDSMWRTPLSSASSKRTKLSSSGAYSSERNNDIPISDEFEPVRPKGTKTVTKRKGKWKATAAEADEWKSLQVNNKRKMDRIDVVRRKVLSPLQKCTATMRMLSYGVSADAVDDYVRIGEITGVERLKFFVSNVITIFEGEYLRKSNSIDVQQLLQMGETRGFSWYNGKY
ncbi:uncharacterized protein LOC141664863 [Apium graveolens]|uniref:uncharacterized protein LOC141664863 n=1 Tax=Apium graveolens TaxID=4045 RepID=UPI003D79A146